MPILAKNSNLLLITIIFAIGLLESSMVILSIQSIVYNCNSNLTNSNIAGLTHIVFYKKKLETDACTHDRPTLERAIIHISDKNTLNGSLFTLMK